MRGDSAWALVCAIGALLIAVGSFLWIMWVYVENNCDEPPSA